jgi:glycosyltransferase involved in cell wall biosynthesis
MRIVQVEDLFFPEAGYQLNLLSKYFARAGHEVYIVASRMERLPSNLAGFFSAENIEERDKAYSEQNNVKIIRVPTLSYHSGRAIFRPGVFRLINALKPDIVYLHGNDTAIGILGTLFHRFLRTPILLDSHMDYVASANRFRSIFRRCYKLFVTPIIRRNGMYVIRTANTDFVLSEYGIPEPQAPIIGFGSDTMLFFPDREARQKTRDELGIGQDAFVFLYAGKMDHGKGGDFLAEAIQKKYVDDAGRDVVFLLIGNISGSPSYAEGVDHLLQTSENRVLRLPTQAYASLPKYYNCADVALFPKQFSLSFFDVQACGLPVISENHPINVERVSHGNGFTYEQNDMQDFQKRIVDFLRMDEGALKEMKQNAVDFVRGNFDYAAVAEKYLEIIESVAS